MNGRIDRRTTIFVLVVTALLEVVAGCGETTERVFPDVDLEPGTSGERITVAEGPKPSQGKLDLTIGEQHGEREPRRARLAIFRAQYDASDDNPISARLVHSVDAELYRDLDRNYSGANQRFTRAKLLDDQGEVVWSKPVKSIYGELQNIKFLVGNASSVDISFQQVFLLAEEEFPELLEFAVRVPTDIEDASSYVLEIPGSDDGRYEMTRVSLRRLTRDEVPPASGTAHELYKTGPPMDRLDFVVLGDGYTPAEKKEFLGDARTIAERMRSTRPFARHKKLMNFHAVWTPSSESGAGYDCRGPRDRDCKRDFRDTVFRYTFAADAIEDRFNLDLENVPTRFGFPIEIGKVYEVAAQTPYDEIILISNTDRRAGLKFLDLATATAYDQRKEFPETVIHEVGHSLGLLGDEYFQSGDPCRPESRLTTQYRNIERDSSFRKLKWRHWVDTDAPLPTPPGLRNVYQIGAYRGASNCDSLFRPAFTCKMRNSVEEFCAVCTEQITRQIYEAVDPVRHGFPAVERAPDGSVVFRSGGHADGELADVTWTFGGKSAGSNPSLRLAPEDVPTRWKKVRLEVQENSDFVRIDDPRLSESRTWWVRAR